MTGEPRVAVVTGAGRGIGAAVARQLRAAGLAVIAAARERVDGDAGLDVTQPDQIDDLAARLGAGFDILINNAAVLLDGFDGEVVRRTLAVNFYGALQVTGRLLPHLRPGGRIVMVSSDMGALSRVRSDVRSTLDAPNLDRRGLLALMSSFEDDVEAGRHTRSGWPSNAYTVSKVGLNALTRVLARELSQDPRGITVNAMSPGWVRTRMGGAAAPRSPDDGARTAVWLSLSPAVAGRSGGFYRDDRLVPW
jgi:carbonyl reductase 1